MAFNGSGTFELTDGVRTEPGVCAAQEAASTGIDSSLFDTMLEDITAGLSNCICKDGQTTVSANIPFNSKKITGLGDCTALKDAANLQFVQNSTSIYLGSTSGSSNAYTATSSPTISGYVEGQVFFFEANHTNTGAATINIDSKGAKNIRKGNGATALSAGDITTGVNYLIHYDGTQFVLMSPYTIVGTTNEIEVTKSTSGVTIGLPNDVTIGDDLTVTDDCSIGGDLTLTGSFKGDVLRATAIDIGTTNSSVLTFKTNNTNRWAVASGGSLLPSTDDTYDIGGSSNQIKNLYISGDLKRDSAPNYTAWQSGSPDATYSLDESALSNADAIACAKVINTMLADLISFGVFS